MSQGFYPGQTSQKVRAITGWAQGVDDPSVVPTVGAIGTMYVQIGTLNIWQKQDNGRTINWLPYTSGGGGGLIVEYRTLTAPEVAAKQLILGAAPASATDVSVNIVSGTAQAYGLDFTVAGNVLDWSGLGMDGLVSLGDVLVISYS